MAMAMVSPPIEEQKQAILRDGFWTLGDPNLGRRVDSITRHGRLKSEEALDLCNDAAICAPVSSQLARKQSYLTVLKRIRAVLGPSFQSVF